MTAEAVPAWFTGTPRRKPGAGRVFYTTNRYPLFYLVIAKCGCTFLRNLIWYLDHDALHPDSANIHAHDEDLPKATLVPREEIQGSPYAFAVVRDPIDRFLSLYFDKLVTFRRPQDKWMHDLLVAQAGLETGPDLDIEAHRRNCLKALEWFAANLDGKTDEKVNPHWQRQSVRLAQAQGIDLRLVTLDGLGWQLSQVLAPLIPDIADRMQAVRERNTSPKPLSRAQILTPEIATAVLATYPEDAEIWARSRAHWGPAPRKEN